MRSTTVIEVVRRLGLALAIISLAAGVLLWSDRSGRRARQDEPTLLPVAILQHGSSAVLDEVRAGVVEGLVRHGFRDRENLAISVLNSEGDIATGNLMAKKVAGGGYRVAITLSTVMLQAMANANREGRTIHVFCAVTSPVDSGVGIKALDSTDKPPYMTGIGTSQPVEELFREMKRLRPGLARVGVVWNPAEVNSEICTRRARAVASELGITLLEASIEQTKDVSEATAALVGRGAEAIWTGGDVTVNNAIDALIAVTSRAGIPVFSNITGHVHRGSLLDLGASYFDVGVEAGRIAGDVLAGADPAAIPVRDFMPKRIVINRKVEQELRPPWQLDAVVLEQAEEIVEPDGTVTRRAPAAPPTPAEAGPSAAGQTSARGGGPPRPWKVRLVVYLETQPSEEAQAGVHAGLAAAGLAEGRDYALSTASAQGDMATLSSIMDGVASDGTEMLITLSTPTLQTALQKVRSLPIVFTFVANPLLVGAGRSDQDHLPNVAGIYTVGRYAEMAELLATYFPAIKRVGTLFSPAEVNSVWNKDRFVEESRAHGVSVETIAASSPAELADAALALASRPIDAIVQIADNLSSGGFAAIARAGDRAQKPVFGFTGAAVEQGAALAIAVDYHQAGFEAGEVAARIMRGARPGDIPFQSPAKKELVVSLPNAQRMHLVLPPALVDTADRVMR